MKVTVRPRAFYLVHGIAAVVSKVLVAWNFWVPFACDANCLDVAFTRVHPPNSQNCRGSAVKLLGCGGSVPLESVDFQQLVVGFVGDMIIARWGGVARTHPLTTSNENDAKSDHSISDSLAERHEKRQNEQRAEPVVLERGR